MGGEATAGGAEGRVRSSRLARPLRAARMPQNEFAFELEHEEEVQTICGAVRRSGLRARLDFGVLWQCYSSVTLCVTDRRLVEIAKPFGGRAPGRRIREYRWSGVRSLRVKGRDVKLAVGDGSKQRWRVVGQQSVPRIREALEARRADIGGQSGDEARPFQTVVCPDCSAMLVPAADRCPSCGTLFVTPREAGWLAALLPGGGHLATGHTLVGTARLVAELLMFFALWTVMGDAERSVFVTPFAAIVLAVVATFKTEAVMTARGFARMIVPWTERARRRWRIASVVGAILMALWYVSAIAMARQTERNIFNDLEFHSADALGWEAKYERPFESSVEGMISRSEWTHADGWRLVVFAGSLRPFESPEGWVREQEAWRIKEGWSRPMAFRAGAVDGVRFTKIERAGGGETASAEYAIFDRLQRDVHVISCGVLASQVEQVDAMVSALLRRAHWVKAGEPCNSKWGPG